MPAALATKTLLNSYRIEEFIALTSLGELYRVTDERSNKPLALTILHKTIAENGEILKEFEANAVRLQGISHPNLNKYLGLGKTPTHVYLLEEWVDGPSLKQIAERGRLNAEGALFLAKSICAGLDALHKHSLLHLNLTPELIRINKRGEVIVCGIGSAKSANKAHKPRLGKYKPTHLSPEQIREEALTPAADIYALSVILYELTTGVWINGKSAPRTLDSIRQTHLDSTPPAPATLNRNLPENFSRMILWALRKAPDERLKTTTELLSALALAAQIPLDKVPPHANVEATPVISNILSTWAFLPPPTLTSVSADAVPLEERLASISRPKNKSIPRNRAASIVVVTLLAGFIALMFFIRPTEEIALPTPIIFTPYLANSTPKPTISPTPRPTSTSGGRIVFTCTRAEYNQLCMVNRDGSGLVQLTDMAASNYYPVFTPDGSSILFASNRNGPFDFFLLNFDKKDISQVTLNVGNVIAPDYSSDGRFIVFANRAGEGPTAVWVVNADGLNPHLVYTGAEDIVSVSWSPDGEKIAYAMSTGTPQEYVIFTMDANGRNHIKISQGLQGIGGSVDWSPDGQSLLVYAGPFGDKDIFEIDVATGNFTQLTYGGNNAGGSYSPNGDYIVFNSLRNNDQADLYTMKADGSALRQITNHPEPDWGASWAD
ncbi:hypothetical protein MASR2M66_10830 [Chloroflexota bacterium]